MRDNIAEILELADYYVITASNGKEGIEQVQKNLPDLVICDIMMPELDGYGVLHILAKNPETARIPFIFLTAKAEKSDFRKGMNLGADDYLTKPFEDIELLDAIEVRLKKSDLVNEDYKQNREGLNRFLDQARGMRSLENLSKDRNTRIYKKKQEIFSEGSYPHALYFINSGKVKTSKINESGKEYITGLHKKGNFIGYVALVKEDAYTESAVALEETDVSIIPRQDFFALLYSNRDVSNKFIKMMSNEITEKERQLITLAYSSVRQRVASALLRLRRRYKEKGKEDPFTISMSRENLASLVGTATESLIRTLSDFREENIIDIRGSHITILKPEFLEKTAN